MTQLNSRKKRNTLIDVNGPTYLAIHDLIERENPNTIQITQRYTNPHTSKIEERLRSITLDNPAPYELHLAKDTATASKEVAGEYNIKIAAFITIGRGSQKVLNRRPGGVFIYNDEAYFMLIWPDVLPCPIPSTTHKGIGLTSHQKRKLDKKQFPTKTFARHENGRKVHYLQKATPEQYKIITDALYQTIANT